MEELPMDSSQEVRLMVEAQNGRLYEHFTGEECDMLLRIRQLAWMVQCITEQWNEEWCDECLSSVFDCRQPRTHRWVSGTYTEWAERMRDGAGEAYARSQRESVIVSKDQWLASREMFYRLKQGRTQKTEYGVEEQYERNSLKRIKWVIQLLKNGAQGSTGCMECMSSCADCDDPMTHMTHKWKYGDFRAWVPDVDTFLEGD